MSSLDTANMLQAALTLQSSHTVSLTTNGQLWGLIALHSYAPRRIPPPLRQLCRLVSDIASTQLERILLKDRVEARKLIEQPHDLSVTRVATPEELLELFDADSAALSINSSVKVSIGALWALLQCAASNKSLVCAS